MIVSRFSMHREIFFFQRAKLLIASVMCLGKKKILLSVLMASVVFVHFSQLICKPLCDIGMNLITL